MITRRKAFKSIGILSGISLLTGAFPIPGISARKLLNNNNLHNKKNRVLIVGSNNHWIQPFLDFGKTDNRTFTIVDYITLQDEKSVQQIKTSISVSELSPSHKLENYLQPSSAFDTILICGIKNPYSLAIKSLSLGYHVWVDRPVNLSTAQNDDIQKLLRKNSVTFLISHLTEDRIILENHPVFAN